MINQSHKSLIFSWRIYPYHAYYIILILILVGSAPYYINLRTTHPKQDDPSTVAPLSQAIVFGIINSYPAYKGNDTSFQLQVNQINNKILYGLTLIKIQKHIKVEPGDRVKVIGRLKIVSSMNYGQYLRRRDIFTEVQAESIEIMLKSETSFIWKRITQSSIGSPYQELRLALILGDRASPLIPEMKQAFQNSGLAHITAASGQNLSLLFFLWFSISPTYLSKQPQKTLIAIPLIICYTILAQAPVSMIRAAIMLGLFLMCQLFEKRISTWNSLVLSALIIYIIDPSYIYEIGFQLSFLATFGVAILAPIIIQIFHMRWKTIPIWLLSWIFIPISATLCTTPIIYIYFSRISQHSIITNLLASPLIAICTWGSILTLGGYLFLEPIGLVLEYSTYPFLWLLYKIALMFQTY